MARDIFFNKEDGIQWSAKPELKIIIIKIIIGIPSVIVLFALFFLDLYYGAYFLKDDFDIMFIYLVGSLTILGIFMALFFGYSIKWLVDYSSLKKREYFITPQKEFEEFLTKTKHQEREQDFFFELNFDDIDRILVRPIKLWKDHVAHIDFYSKVLTDKYDDFATRIENVNSIDPDISLIFSKKGNFHRFFYIRDYKQVIEILSEITPNKLTVGKNN